jgi:hypothetical protein
MIAMLRTCGFFASPEVGLFRVFQANHLKNEQVRCKVVLWSFLKESCQKDAAQRA